MKGCIFMRKCKLFIAFAGFFFACILTMGFCTETLAAEKPFDWSYQNGVLTISGEGRMPDVAEGEKAPWSEYADKAVEIHIENGVTSIGARAFYGFFRVKSVTIPDSVAEIGAHAFSHCSALSTVDFPEYLSSIGEGAFRSCTALKRASLPASCRKLGAYAFASCTALKEVHLPAVLKDIGGFAFFGASALESVQLPATLKSIPESCFRGCVSLRALSLPTLLTSIGDYAFFGCSALESCQLPNGLTGIGAYGFSGSGIGSVHFPESVTSIGVHAFSSCRQLVSLTLPSGLTAIADGLFYSCEKLSKIELPSCLETIGKEAFSYCLALQEVTIPSGVRAIGTHAFAYDTALKKVNFFADSCLVAGDSASPVFRGCVALTEMVFGENVTLVPSSLCYGLTGLLKVSMGASVREIGSSAFEGCTALESIFLPEALQRVGASAFYRCFALKSLLVPKNLLAVGRYAFYTASGGKLFLQTKEEGEGFADGWKGDAEALYLGSWALCEFYARGQVISVVYVELGGELNQPNVPSYESKKGYTAYFSGWDLNGDGQADALPYQVFQSLRAEALFRELPNRYQCRFFDDDGSLLAEFSLYYDSPVLLPNPPTKESDGQYKFAFLGWSGYTEGMTVSGDTDFTALYEASLIDIEVPTVIGIASGEKYYADRKIRITDDGRLVSVTLDGKPCTIQNGMAVLTLSADGKSHTLVAYDEAGREVVLEVEGVSISSIVSAMMRGEMATVGQEATIMQALDEIDSLLSISEVGENDRLLLTERKNEILQAYRLSAIKNAFVFERDDSQMIDRERLLLGLQVLFDEEEVEWLLHGGSVLFTASATRIANGELNANFSSLAKAQDKVTDGGFFIEVICTITDKDGHASNTFACDLSGIQCYLRLSPKQMKQGGSVLALRNGEFEVLTPADDGSLSLSLGEGASFALLYDKEEGIGWRVLLVVVILVSLITSVSLGISARLWAKRRVKTVTEENTGLTFEELLCEAKKEQSPNHAQENEDDGDDGLSGEGIELEEKPDLDEDDEPSNE